MCADLGGRLCTSEELLADCTRVSGCGGDQVMISGGRLCTSEELLADCARSSGCSLDQKDVWSSTVAP